MHLAPAHGSGLSSAPHSEPHLESLAIIGNISTLRRLSGAGSPPDVISQTRTPPPPKKPSGADATETLPFDGPERSARCLQCRFKSLRRHCARRPLTSRIFLRSDQTYSDTDGNAMASNRSMTRARVIPRRCSIARGWVIGRLKFYVRAPSFKHPRTKKYSSSIVQVSVLELQRRSRSASGIAR